MWLLLVLGCGAHTASETLTPDLGGAETTVDLYWPETAEPAPLVVVAHGFARSRHRMRGWGEVLSAKGYAVAVPDLPYLAAHHDNADAVVDLVRQLRADPRVDPEHLVLVGFSAGGLVTARAATELDGVDLWLGLDPVDAERSAETAAASLTFPGVAVFAEPQGCNAHGNGRAIWESWAGPAWTVRVRGATHCDPERPSDLPCAAFCGKAQPARSDAFVELATDALDAVLRCDEAALLRLDLAGADGRLSHREDRGFVRAVRERCHQPRTKTPGATLEPQSGSG